MGQREGTDLEEETSPPGCACTGGAEAGAGGSEPPAPGCGSRWCSQPGLLPCRQLPAGPWRCRPQPGLEPGLCCPDAFVIARWTEAFAQSGGHAPHAAVPSAARPACGRALLRCWVKGAPVDGELLPRWGGLKQVLSGCVRLSVCLACLPLLLLLHLGHAGSRQGRCGAVAVMFNSPAWGQGRQSVAEGLSPGTGAEPPSREQGAFRGQADPVPPELVPPP